MVTLHYYINCLGGVVKYKPLEGNWTIDWCTEAEFINYAKYLWGLNSENFNRELLTFNGFLEMEYILLQDLPAYFQFTMEKLGFIKNKN